MARFFLEYLRDDPGRGSVFNGAMTGTQLIAMGLVVAGGVIWWLRRGAKAVPAQTVGAPGSSDCDIAATCAFHTGASAFTHSTLAIPVKPRWRQSPAATGLQRA